MPGFSIEQSEEYEGDDWWNWAVWVVGDKDALDQIKYVEWRLHPTFRDPVRKRDDRSTGFRLQTAGWGVFTIIARACMKDGTDKMLRHRLRLHYPDGSETNA